jgi:hypothetical protein
MEQVERGEGNREIFVCSEGGRANAPTHTTRAVRTAPPAVHVGRLNSNALERHRASRCV